MTNPTPLSPACVNTEAVTDPALPRPMSEDYQAGHPTPPPELVQQWCQDSPEDDEQCYIADQAARWGADQELKACLEWMKIHLHSGSSLSKQLRAARRPKPPSLKERALLAWAAVEAGTDDQTAMAVIRRALEALPE